MSASSAFYAQDASARTSWRLAVLMGANSRTYKFALGAAVLDAAGRGQREIPLAELAAPYALELARRLGDAPQAPEGAALRDSDFLTIAKEERAGTLEAGQPTERLLEAATRSMPAMVMQKFHNLRGGIQVPHRFFELTGDSRKRVVRLTGDALRIARSEQAVGLQAELDARWSIVESSFAAGVGRSLIEDGVAVDWDSLRLTDKKRRRSVTKVADALIGFQHGRCLICDEVVSPEQTVAVDHVFPFALMRRLHSVRAWAGPDLDALWNLAPAHAACNGGKSDRLPFPVEVHRLALRNEAIMDSPHPLRKTLQLSLRQALGGRRSTSWPEFLQAVRDLAI
ncbi:HNH endonuclease domain-containing protein [Streptomyces bicolor]|uniref:HNH endonuclease domain-containing protein n=1 Tax=Streptomyces bicolor TaxID=66874 RepID=UPI0004E187ED|nr:HNH endonuclease domain-containing protein [Streptomyces bicolor]